MAPQLPYPEGSSPPRVATWIATALGAGYSPVAPGTAGTLVALPLAAALAPLADASTAAYLLVLAASSAVAMWAAGEAARGFGLKDPGQVVVDEVVGLFLAMAFVPATPANLVAAFFLFRFFDITKPPPCRRAETLPGGVGIVADDLLAGVYANLALRALVLAWPGGVFSL